MSTTEVQRDLKRIRRLREGTNSDSITPEVEIFTCPVEGCFRTVVGNPGDLKNHVSQVGDDAHEGLRLNDDLELVEVTGSSVNDFTGRGYDVEEYTSTWGPGIRGDEPREDDWSMYDDYEGTWGPGVPETEVRKS